jgi:hypothetical protein
MDCWNRRTIASQVAAKCELALKIVVPIAGDVAKGAMEDSRLRLRISLQILINFIGAVKNTLKHPRTHSHLFKGATM